MICLWWALCRTVHILYLQWFSYDLYLKFVVDAALAHNCICGMSWFYFGINGYISVGDWTVPDIVIAFSASHKSTAILQHDFSHFLFILSHYKIILSCRSDLNVKEKGCRSDAFSSSSSGTAKRVRSSNASNEPDSSTSPGISLLVAIHTFASESHVKFII